MVDFCFFKGRLTAFATSEWHMLPSVGFPVVVTDMLRFSVLPSAAVACEE